MSNDSDVDYLKIDAGSLTSSKIDKEDLKEKADYYMKHPEEAEKLAKQGHQLVLEEHTFEKRMKKLVKDLEKI